METREIYWNIEGIWLMYALFAATAAVFAYGAYETYRSVAIGRPEKRSGSVLHRLKGLALQSLLQQRLLREAYSGSMHFLMFWGFVVLTIGTLVVFLEADFGLPIMRGNFYLFFQSLTLDILGMLAIVGVLLAIVKRYLIRPDRLANPLRLRTLGSDAVLLGLLLVILVTGFLIEGARIATTVDPWAGWSPVGNAVAQGFIAGGMDSAGLQSVHRYLWWFHLLVAFAFIAYIPYSKLRHLVLSPVNIYFRSLEPAGALKPTDMQSAETLGAPHFKDLTWKQLLDLEACTECGRCQTVCPAYSAGQPLTPKAIVLDLHRGLRQSVPSVAGAMGDPTSPDPTADAPTIAAAGADAIWSCVTCGSCMERCPVYIEHVPTIVEMRRYLVMERAEYPELMQEALTSMEARGHPFRGTRFSRTDWCEGMDVKIVGESGAGEWLYWVGCAAALDERNQKVARAFATLMQRSDVDFRILGEEEQCTGDAARRIGNEYLFQMMAQGNIETLNRYGIKKIVTACPHCYNTLKNEYPQFGGNYEVCHHTELIDQLLRNGKLRPGQSLDKSLAYHDSCYLARYNQICDPPRDALQALKGLDIMEADNAREQTFCCGGGGGHMWFEENQGGRISHERADQLLCTGAQMVGTACPFCMTMLSDGVTARQGEKDVRVLDVAELVELATRPQS